MTLAVTPIGDAAVMRETTPKPPGGRWTVVQFPLGAPADAIRQLTLEAVRSAKATRAPGEVWCAELGEFFMAEGQPVLLLSPKVPKAVLDGLSDCFEYFGPVRVRKNPRTSLAFRGRPVAWLQDDFEREWTA